MSRFLSVVAAMAVCASFSGCGLLPFGGGGSSYKPADCFNNQYAGDLADAKVGRSVTYAMEAGGQKTLMTTKIVGKDGDAWWIESWMEMPSMAYGFLWKVGSDKKISEGYAAAKDDKEWTKITVKEPPKVEGQAGGQKPTIKESNEKKEVKAGAFDCKKLDVTVNVQGKDYTSIMWYSKDVWKIAMPSEHGGTVAMEASGSKTSLEAKAEDAKPTIELPAKK
jgi:hypothetical protein